MKDILSQAVTVENEKYKELPEPEYVITYSDMPPLGEHRMSEEDIIKYMIDNKMPAHSCSCGCIKVKVV